MLPYITITITICLLPWQVHTLQSYIVLFHWNFYPAPNLLFRFAHAFTRYLQKSFHSYFIIWTNFSWLSRYSKVSTLYLILLNRLIFSSLYSLQIKIKWNSSSTDGELHIWQVLSSSAYVSISQGQSYWIMRYGRGIWNYMGQSSLADLEIAIQMCEGWTFSETTALL